MKYTSGKTQSIPSLRDNDGNVTDNSFDKAELLNAAFRNSVTKEDEVNIPEFKTRTAVSMSNIEVDSLGVAKQLKSLNKGRSTGPDCIPITFLSEYADSIAPYLAVIYNRSLDERSVPKDWKVAQVTPIFKKGNRSDPLNYRPISLTSICSRILEHILYSNIMSHLEANDLLTRSQHGFRKHRSCATQLALYSHEVMRAIDGGSQVDSVFLDFRKAFDTVPHKRLLIKLRAYGISSQLCDWIRDFLSERSQFVVIDGKSSSKTEVISGVPQGSVKGPLLFLVYINDLGDNLSSPLRLFADDAVIYRLVNSSDDQFQLQSDLEKISDWCDKWQLTLNKEKCEVMHMSTKRNPFQFDYMINHTVLKAVNSTKYLGITITNSFSWKDHIDNIVGKANQRLRFVGRTLRRCNKSTKETAYSTLVRPLLEYCCAVWDPYQVGLSDEIEKVQRKAARFVLSRNRGESVTDMIRELGWQSLKQRRVSLRRDLFTKFQSPTFSSECENILLAPTYIGRNDHQSKIREIRARTERFRCSFFPRAIREWNGRELV